MLDVEYNTTYITQHIEHDKHKNDAFLKKYFFKKAYQDKV